METFVPQIIELPLSEPLVLKKGGTLEKVEIALQTHGHLNATKDNAILICHPLTMDANVSDGGQDHAIPGWWNFLVGPQRPVDTERFFVVCCNVIGGCKGSTGPMSVNPKTQTLYRTEFPEITIQDMVVVQKLLLDHLDVKSCYAVIGGSLGGMQALEWSVRYPHHVQRCIAIATGSQLSSQGLAFDVVGRECITGDPSWNHGRYDSEQGVFVKGLALARMIGHITYISKNMMEEKFGRRLQDGKSDEGFKTAFAIESFLHYNSEKFIQRFDPNSYLYLSKAMDTYDLSEGFASLEDSLARSNCETLVISFSSDWLFPPGDSIQLASTLARLGHKVTYANIETDLGHDAFLIDAPEIAHMKDLVQKFLLD
jgi:homoserine O-acetyltransferase/O-succinyltransferase